MEFGARRWGIRGYGGAVAETTMTTPRGNRALRRPNTAESSPLRAWSAADQLVLDHLGRRDLGRTLIINDEFGAVTCGLAEVAPTIWSDSAVSRGAIQANLAANGFDALTGSQLVRGSEQPTGPFATVVVRIPKSTELLDYQLAVVGSLSSQGTTIVGAAMARHVHRSTVALFELLGPTTTSRATQKARLLFSEPIGGPSAPVELPTSEFVTEAGVCVVEHPGTFSAGRLDVGTALLLDVLSHQPPPGPGASVVDVGCGNGVIVASAALLWGVADRDFVAIDASDLAVAAAEATWRKSGLGGRFTPLVADGFSSTADDSVDVVMTNPPFHHGHAHDPELTDGLLAGAARVLRADGVAYVVVQRHLQLHRKLQRWFASVEAASKHPSHVVLIARQPRQ